MSMSIRCDGCGLEYAGARDGARGIIARPVEPAARPLPADAGRGHAFYRRARALLDGHVSGEPTPRSRADPGRVSGPGTLQPLLHLPLHDAGGQRRLVLRPHHRAVLSGPVSLHLPRPPRHARRQGLAPVATVTGGSRSYVEKLAATLPDVRLGTPVPPSGGTPPAWKSRRRPASKVFDAVVIATHPAQALGIPGRRHPGRKRILGGMPYSVTSTVFHRDPAVLPAQPRRPGVLELPASRRVRARPERCWSATTSPASSG